MKAVILYDSRTKGGSTDSFVDSLGLSLAESGIYVEKAKCKINADYSFIKDFDLVILGAPVYYFVVSSDLIGALIQSNLKKCLKRKKLALFVICGSPEPMGTVFYLPQMKMHLVSNRILTEKIIATQNLLDPDTVESFASDILDEYENCVKPKTRSLAWTDEALEVLDSVPVFLHDRFRSVAEEYALSVGYTEITVSVLASAKMKLSGQEL